MVKTRFAPSPTGLLHVGALRTALFNYLYAKNQGGKFILRIEDTDRERFVEGSIENIIESLEWSNLEFDEGPFYQSQRLEIYRKYADKLLKDGLGYEDKGAIRFKIPKGREITFTDLIRGEVTISSDTLEDFVLLKSDGYPTYNFANVADDHDMEITHVIRGEEFISSTPKHILLYEALGFTPPHFAHVPQILGKDKAKLSKRHGAKMVLEYSKEGILPQALINFLGLLGWHPKDERELFTLNDLTKAFALKDVQRSPASFDTEKLLWFNSEYLKKLDELSLIEWFLGSGLGKDLAKEKVLGLAKLLVGRARNYEELKSGSDFFFNEPNAAHDLTAFGDANKINEVLASAKEIIEKNDIEMIEEKLRESAGMLEIKTGDFFMILRLSITGSRVSPPLIPVIEILGREKTVQRLQNQQKKVAK